MPSGEVAQTLLPTAANKPNCGDHVIAIYVPAGIVLEVHVVPSVEVAQTLLTPTAANIPNSGDQTTCCQFALAIVRAVHVMPSGEVCTLVPPPSIAANKPSCGDHAIVCHAATVAALSLVHV